MADRHAHFLGTGWKFPPAFSRDARGVELVSGEEDIRESLWILLSTSPGERVMVPQFGCALWQMVFERLDLTAMTRMEDLVSRAIVNWEPRIICDRVVAETDASVAGLVRLQIAYTVRATNARSNLVYPFYAHEGTIAPPLP